VKSTCARSFDHSFIPWFKVVSKALVGAWMNHTL
jgi:hypothetical protein